MQRDSAKIIAAVRLTSTLILDIPSYDKKGAAMLVTLDSLLEIACEAERVINEEAGVRPATDRCREAFRVREQAMAAAKWLEEGGLTEIEQIGPFGRIDVKRGDTVIVKKGAVINSMNPRYTRDNPKIAKRDYQVKVTSVTDGYIMGQWHSHRRESRETHFEQQISWPGEGGYWCYLDTKYVETLPQ